MGSSQVNIYLWRSLMKETSIRRNSVIELLRLIAMFAIVLHHYSIHGGMALAHGISCSTLTIAAGQSLGEWGVDVFVLITGYYLSNNLSVSKHLGQPLALKMLLLDVCQSDITYGGLQVHTLFFF
jgi:peptidoglycan/LPS O-acetylase OafA/YrhL